MPTTTAPPTRATAREWIGLAVLALPAMLVIMDLTVLHLAVPHLTADLQPSSTQLLWITDIYGFLIAGFLITMGGLGDRIGRRRLLFVGAGAFGAASVLAAFAPTAELLILARAVLGIAGATLMPSTLSLIRNMFHDPQQRTTAISVWAMSFMLGGALGPLVGGALLQWFWWGSVFLLAVPVMVLLLVAGPFLLPEYRSESAGRLDLASAVMLLAMVLPLIYGMKRLAEDGFGWLPVATAALGLAVGVAFVRRQRRLADPLIDVTLFRNPAFSASLGVLTAATFVMMGLNLFLMQYLQLVHGLSPLQAGLWSLPQAGAGLVGMILAPVLVRSIRPAYLIAAGMAFAAAGIFLFTRLEPDQSLAVVVTGTAIMSFGFAPAMALGVGLVVGAAPPERAGAASAVNETAGELGGALGLAVLGSIGTAVYRDRVDDLPAEVPAGAVAAARDTLAGALATAEDLPAGLASTVTQTAQAAFTDATAAVAYVGLVLIAMASVAAAVLLRRVQPANEPAETETAASERTERDDEAAALVQ